MVKFGVKKFKWIIIWNRGSIVYKEPWKDLFCPIHALGQGKKVCLYHPLKSHYARTLRNDHRQLCITRCWTAEACTIYIHNTRQWSNNMLWTMALHQCTGIIGVLLATLCQSLILQTSVRMRARMIICPLVRAENIAADFRAGELKQPLVSGGQGTRCWHWQSHRSKERMCWCCLNIGYCNCNVCSVKGVWVLFSFSS